MKNLLMSLVTLTVLFLPTIFLVIAYNICNETWQGLIILLEIPFQIGYLVIIYLKTNQTVCYTY